MFRVWRVLHVDLYVCSNFPIYKFLVNWHSWDRPTEEPFGGLCRQVDAAMTARMAIIIVPIGAMKGDAAFCNIQHPRHTGQVKSAGSDIAGRHMTCGTFMERREIAIGRGVCAAA